MLNGLPTAPQISFTDQLWCSKLKLLRPNRPIDYVALLGRGNNRSSSLPVLLDKASLRLSPCRLTQLDNRTKTRRCKGNFSWTEYWGSTMLSDRRDIAPSYVGITSASTEPLLILETSSLRDRAESSFRRWRCRSLRLWHLLEEDGPGPSEDLSSWTFLVISSQRLKIWLAKGHECFWSLVSGLVELFAWTGTRVWQAARSQFVWRKGLRRP